MKEMKFLLNFQPSENIYQAWEVYDLPAVLPKHPGPKLGEIGCNLFLHMMSFHTSPFFSDHLSRVH